MTDGRTEAQQAVYDREVAKIRKLRKGRTLTGAELIAEERLRQLDVERFVASHDDQWTDGQLARAGIAYARSTLPAGVGLGRAWWPKDWPDGSFKPDYDDPVRDLVRAAALLAAEIDRRLRAR